MASGTTRETVKLNAAGSAEGNQTGTADLGYYIFISVLCSDCSSEFCEHTDILT